MQKIMFNKPYGLQHAVECGYKTMTRCPVGKRMTEDDIIAYLKGYTELANKCAQYKIGEVVAVAQSYKDLGYTKEWVEQHISPNPNAKPTDPFEKKYPGWSNKMFVRADLMPLKIQITDIKVERLQDISNEDCLKEGVFLDVTVPECYKPFYTFVNSKTKDNTPIGFENPQYAFQVLIDKLSGFGTWDRNDWQFAYTFKLIK